MDISRHRTKLCSTTSLGTDSRYGSQNENQQRKESQDGKNVKVRNICEAPRLIRVVRQTNILLSSEQVVLVTT